MHKDKRLPLACATALVPFIIYFFFFSWKTGTAYGDDLYMFKAYSGLNGFWDKINLPLSFGKFRPVHGFITHLLISWFKDDIHGYYVFNIAIQSLNTFLLALIVNIFLRAPLLSLLVGLTCGLSRFAYFNISQLLNGGALEGIALSFFLFSVYFLIKALTREVGNETFKNRFILLSILFANFSMYTHERYIVILVFIAFTIISSPILRTLALQKRLTLFSLVALSIALNVLIKKYVYHMPFFVGTGGTNISFSFSSAFGYFLDAISSIFQFNSGPEYLIGIKFSSLPFTVKILIILIALFTIISISLFLKKTKGRLIQSYKKHDHYFSTFVLLFILFGLMLAPAIVTIRLEQRWLQASAAILIIVLSMAISGISFANPKNRTALVAFFSILFIITEFTYLQMGVNNTYLSNSEKVASSFKKAIYTGVISPSVSALYLLEPKRDQNSENGIRWELGGGYLFDFYQKREKQIFFIDTSYRAIITQADTTKLTSDTIQIVSLDANVENVTGKYIDKQLGSTNSIKLALLPRVPSETGALSISHTDIDKFNTSGFYNDESGFRWTAGSATIDIYSAFQKNDTVEVELETYMPPVCKEVSPAINFIDTAFNVIQPFHTSRQADKFRYKFHFSVDIIISQVKIEAKTIPVTPPDARELSFPFIRVGVKKL